MTKVDPDIFSRTRLLIGETALAQMAAKRVILFGVGGVGSWCAETLVRTGIHHLTIVDSDVVMASNINRQLPATTLTVGQPKVEVLRRRLLQINPAAEITALQMRFNQTTADSFRLEEYDYVIDAIDSLKDKAELILRSTAIEHVTLLSSMGAALKMDPTRIRIADFRKVEGDPLARALRNKFKQLARFPQKKFLCVYSDEHLQDTCDNAEHAHGTAAHITAIFGNMLASIVVQDVYRLCKTDVEGCQ